MSGEVKSYSDFCRHQTDVWVQHTHTHKTDVKRLDLIWPSEKVNVKCWASVREEDMRIQRCTAWKREKEGLWLRKEPCWKRAALWWQSPISKDPESWESGWGCCEEPWLGVINMPSQERETQTSWGSRVPGFYGYLGTHSCSIRAAPVCYSRVPGMGDLWFLLHSSLCFCIWTGISLEHGSPRNRFSNPENHMPRGPVRVCGDLEIGLCLQSNPWRSPIDELTWDRVTHGGGQLKMASSSIWVNGAIQQGWVQCETLFLPLLGTKKSLRDRLRYTILLTWKHNLCPKPDSATSPQQAN